MGQLLLISQDVFTFKGIFKAVSLVMQQKMSLTGMGKPAWKAQSSRQERKGRQGG